MAATRAATSFLRETWKVLWLLKTSGYALMLARAGDPGTSTDPPLEARTTKKAIVAATTSEATTTVRGHTSGAALECSQRIAEAAVLT
jgi:hypothetical protein